MERSREADIKIINASELKNKLQSIISNINELERLAANIGTVARADIEKLQLQTSKLLNQVEGAPLERISKHVQRRKKKRQNKKLTRYSKTKHDPTPSQVALVTDTPTKVNTIEVPTLTTPSANQPYTVKLHQQLRNLSDAQRFLRTFELLKMLHLARSRNVEATREFAAQFNNLYVTWNNVLQENSSQRTQSRHIEDQWNEVLFGPNEELYYRGSGESKVSDLLRVRRIWDSYLTRSKHGTTIPSDWVLPKESATTDWQQFCAI